MPELAEVEYYRKRWDPVLGQKIERVALRSNSRLLRGVDSARLTKTLTGSHFAASEAAAKQMLFKFTGAFEGTAWLGIHLGMTGELKLESVDYMPDKHVHLTLYTAQHALVFADFRQFGRIQFSVGNEAPEWWSSIAPPVVSKAFTLSAVADFLKRRKKAPIKAVLLMQERFPGIGNWMADEILWRAEIHPKRLAGSLTEAEIKALHRETRWVAREALRTIGKDFRDPPKMWLFPHRWEKGGICPKTGVPLKREEIGGRTTCWSPGRQSLRALHARRNDE
jgi:formamidopyrimidine-DNA glycosylase